MNEQLLQYIWQFQYFSKAALTTTEGSELQIIHPGTWNRNQGPDFLMAKVKIGDTTWAGSIEIHIASSDWNKHGHRNNSQYDKIILHVVWNNDAEIRDAQGNVFPTLALEQRVSRIMLETYNKWMLNMQMIACGNQWQTVKEIVWEQWKERLLIERLQQKAGHIETLLHRQQQHWEQICWVMVCRYFGGSVNAESFEQIASSLPVTLLARHKDQLHQLEALLMGQAGLLHNRFTDQYPLMLYKEYQYLQKKYSLRVVNKPPSFLRLRPANFPTIRLSQLANLVHVSQRLFTNSMESEQPPFHLLQCTANDYWLYHYKPDEPSALQQKPLGKQMQDIIIINALAPLLFAYGRHVSDDNICQRAIQWLRQIPGEKNKYTNHWTKGGMHMQNAAQSQSIIELTKNYCQPKRCLECAIGNAILKK